MLFLSPPTRPDLNCWFAPGLVGIEEVMVEYLVMREYMG